MRVGWYAGGRAIWELTLHGIDVPGRWIVVDRQIRMAR